MKYRVLVLLLAIVGAAATGCKKSSHEIIYGDIIDNDNPTELIKVLRVETTKGNDREGDYYTDRFYLENKKKIKFDKGDYQATLDIGFFSDVRFEDTVEGPVITVSRRKKNATYELKTLWVLPDNHDPYVLKYSFTAKDE